MTDPYESRVTTPEAAGDDSRASAVRPRPEGAGIAGRIRASGPVAWAILLLSLASAVLLVATELSTLSYRTIGIGACDDRVQQAGVCHTSGGAAHHHIFWLLALAVLVFGFGAGVGRSRPAGAALVACGVAVLVVALAFDASKLDQTRGLEALYTDVRAHTGSAFWLELVGGGLSVVAGLLGMRRPPESRARERERSARRAQSGTSPAG